MLPFYIGIFAPGFVAVWLTFRSEGGAGVRALLSRLIQWEEVGWRGYGLPRLDARFGLAGASIVVGIIWATWHLPLFFIPGTGTTGQSFPIYLLGVTAISVAIAWLYQHTNGSLFLTMLMHSAINNTKDIVPSIGPKPTNPFAINASLIGWLTAGLMWVWAAYVLFRMKRKTAPDEGRA
jgi:membrane protease YdiL (CAAX protease family)